MARVPQTRRLRPWLWVFGAVSLAAFVSGWLSYEERGLGGTNLNPPPPFDAAIIMCSLLLPVSWIILFAAAILVLRWRVCFLAISAPVAFFWSVADALWSSSGCDGGGFFPCGV